MEALAFYACLSILSTKTIIAEQFYSLMLEGINRQRIELAKILLVYYKKDKGKLRAILSVLLILSILHLFLTFCNDLVIFRDYFQHFMTLEAE